MTTDARLLHLFGTASNPSAQEQLALLEASVDDLRAHGIQLVDVDELPEVKLSHDRASVPLGEFALALEAADGGEAWRGDVAAPVDELLGTFAAVTRP